MCYSPAFKWVIKLEEKPKPTNLTRQCFQAILLQVEFSQLFQVPDLSGDFLQLVVRKYQDFEVDLKIWIFEKKRFFMLKDKKI